jgi:hypothetical protein
MKKQAWMTVGMMLAAGLALAADGELKPVNVPEQAPGLIDWLLGSKVVSIAKYAAIITMAVQIIKTAAVLFGGKLPPKVTAGVVALVGFLTLWEAATADGQINGGDWSALIVSLAATVCAFFGYKLLFSAKSAVNLD